MELKGSIFTLRGWQPADMQSLQQQADNKNISNYLFDRFPYPFTIADAEKFISAHHGQDPVTNFAIIIDSNVVGGIELKPGTDIYRKTAPLGYWLGEAFWGQGIMTEVVKLITTHAFEKFDIIRLQASVNSNNPASMRVLEKAGFKGEAILKNAIFKNNEIMDEHLFVLLKQI
ncbi:MAG TPA: GNAT family protein [Mucilaginibacter sp.]|jgi:RimJ/RimL family protein N-acetyltransferase